MFATIRRYDVVGGKDAAVPKTGILHCISLHSGRYGTIDHEYVVAGVRVLRKVLLQNLNRTAPLLTDLKTAMPKLSSQVALGQTRSSFSISASQKSPFLPMHPKVFTFLSTIVYFRAVNR